MYDESIYELAADTVRIPGSASDDYLLESYAKVRTAVTAVSEELEGALEEVISQAALANVHHLGRQRTLWLAAPPFWTRSVAESAGFPIESDESITEFVKRASAMGWCKTRGSLPADGPTELRFWMPDEVRHAVLDIAQLRRRRFAGRARRCARCRRQRGSPRG